MELPDPLNPQFAKWIGVVMVLDLILLPMPMKWLIIENQNPIKP